MTSTVGPESLAMTPDPRLIDVLVGAEDLLRSGQEIALEDLCRDCPELAAEVNRRLAGLQAVEEAWAGDAATSRGDPFVTQVRSSSEPTPPSVRDVPVRSTRYQPIRFHAEGGLGEVHVARDREVKREVALKRLQARHAHNADCRMRFLREAQITARLEHPGIVPVYGVVEDAEGQPSYAMRFVEGATLHDALLAFHRPPTRNQQATLAPNAETLEFGVTRSPEDVRDRQQAGGGSFHSVEFHQLLQRFVTVCNTMAYAHSKGVVHRDLKPANILLGKYGETLVVDWGLAKCLDADAQAAGEMETTDYSPELLFASRVDRAASDEDPSDGSLTLAGQALGTPVFMSPEQAAGDWQRVGIASDIYSLGATLYALLTGSAPIQERAWERIREKILSGDIPAPRQVHRNVPRALEAVCLKAMSHRPEDRYPSPLELARDVEHWLADEPVTTWREPWRDRAGRWARRHRPIVAGTTVAGVLLIAGLITGAWFWRTAEQRRTQAAEHYSANLRRDAEAAERLALAAIGAGDFPAAAAILAEKLGQLENEPEQQDLRDRLVARHQRVQRLVRFYLLSDSAERLVLHLSDQDAARSCEAGLKELRIFEHLIWWEHLPVEDFPSGSQLVNKLHEDVYRQLLLLASFRAKDAFVRLLSRDAQKHYRSALEALAAAQRFRPSHMATLGELICQVGLGETNDVKPLPPPTPTCAADYYFLGFIQFWVAPLTEQDWTSGVIVRTFKGLSGLDFDTPLATAERYLRMAAALEPEHYWTHAWLSTVLMAARNPAGAYLAANACVALRPDEATGIRLRGRALLALAIDAKDAERRAEHLWRGLVDFDRAVSLAPYDADTHFFALLLYDSLHLWPEAIAAGARTFELLPPFERDGTWDQVFRREAVRKMLEKYATARHPRPNDALYHTVIAHGYLLIDEYEKAFQIANRALLLQSDHAPALAIRGQVRLQRNEIDAALKDFEAALDQNPENYLAWGGRARTDEILQRWDDALASYDRLERVAVVPWQRRQALEGRSRALERLGRQAEARAATEQARTLDPTNSPAPRSDGPGSIPANAAAPDFVPAGTKLDRKYALVHVYRSLAHERQQRTKEAEEEWQKALRLAPKAPELFLHRGAALRDSGQVDRAIADFTAAIDMDKDNASYYCARANCYAAQQRTSEALADFQAALQVHPGYAPALVDRGQLYVNTRDYDRAIADFTEALRLFPSARGEILGKRGAAYRLRGDLAKALDDLNAAIKLLPKSAALYNERGLIHRARRDQERAVADFDTAAKLDPKRAIHPR